ncbi:C39 family peptidase [Sanyastnella coralliicola]|uniref:C39 family peptidase n=1 Tax=Sanyastnella coralliicola TaxID=3069118 RepID=UPI0027B9AE2C|nr:papain-like cysteine protease family protein [Longitalea sp. SCSIO 12813]
MRYLLVIFMTLACGVASAQSIQQTGPNYFIAGVPTVEFEFMAAESVYGNQRQANWCWAACSQMVLNYHGLYVTQEQIVHHIYGDLVDRPANANQIRRALSGWAPNIRGGYSTIHCSSVVNHVNEITQALAYKWPLIVGLRNPNGGVGHAYVLTAIEYSVDQWNNTIPHYVILRDPMPGTDGKIRVPWNVFENRVMMMFKVWVN